MVIFRSWHLFYFYFRIPPGFPCYRIIKFKNVYKIQVLRKNSFFKVFVIRNFYLGVPGPQRWALFLKVLKYIGAPFPQCPDNFKYNHTPPALAWMAGIYHTITFIVVWLLYFLLFRVCILISKFELDTINLLIPLPKDKIFRDNPTWTFRIYRILSLFPNSQIFNGLLNV